MVSPGLFCPLRSPLIPCAFIDLDEVHAFKIFEKDSVMGVGCVRFLVGLSVRVHCPPASPNLPALYRLDFNRFVVHGSSNMSFFFFLTVFLVLLGVLFPFEILPVFLGAHSPF